MLRSPQAARGAMRCRTALLWLLALLPFPAVGTEASGTPSTESLATERLATDNLATNGPPADGSTTEARVRSEGEVQRDQLMEISCRDAENHPDSWLDRTHSYLNRRLCEPAAWFDGFFGDDRALEETPVGTFFRLRNEVRWDETEDYRIRVRLNANISLPGASERLRLLVTRDEDVRGEFEPDTRIDGSQNDTRVGLRYNLREDDRSRFDLQATIKANFSSVNPVARARYRHVRQLTDETFARFTQIAFWEADDGFGTTSRADWEWYPGYDTQLRLTGQGTWSEATSGVEWQSAATAFRQLDQKTAIRSELGAVGRTRPEWETLEYFVNFRYRRAFLRPWLFYELQPEHAWPVDQFTGERRADWRFTVTLEIQFENEPAREERTRRRLLPF
ncbi:MAG: hypothetical protein KF911_13830 [Pseudomonadales bacterium]|nr:hypothetical protein [Pseudomonadales bacterium]